ncbi:major facilitator superfamily domain-containing protein [Xylaria arbuscula]|nr:major facilitator superfamily domain-containing protein [Xylaria arbuscula]
MANNVASTPNAGDSSRPLDRLSIQDAPAVSEVSYPQGVKLQTTVASLCIVSLLYGLDLAIVAAALPSLTNYFQSIKDIGWYSSAYSIVFASFGFLFGKLYGLFPAKRLYMASLCIFELGSLVCTLARSSPVFILGRAIAGLGAAGLSPGSVVILSHCFPRNKLPIWTTVVASSQLFGIVGAPIIGGGLIDWLGWRACFGINIPLGVAAFAFVAFGLDSADSGANQNLSLKEKLKKFDWFGTFLIVPGLISLLLALQWGGSIYGWKDARIIILFVLFAVLLAAFGWCQHRLQDKAILPPRILRKRTVLTGAWFSSCVEAILSVTEYYISIYFQGIKGYTATRSGLFILPLLAGIAAGNLLGGLGTTWLGYYNPFMLATTILAPVASGLLTTIEFDESASKAAALLGFLGIAAGLGLQGPVVALQTTMKQPDLSVGVAITGFGATLGSAVWIVVSTAVFHSRLTTEIAQHSPSVNSTLLESAGLSEIRNIVGSDRLRDVLLGYDEALVQTLYLPVGLAVASIVGSALLEWRSVKTE